MCVCVCVLGTGRREGVLADDFGFCAARYRL